MESSTPFIPRRQGPRNSGVTVTAERGPARATQPESAPAHSVSGWDSDPPGTRTSWLSSPGKPVSALNSLASPRPPTSMCVAYLMLYFRQDVHQLLQCLVVGPQLHSTDTTCSFEKAGGGATSTPPSTETVQTAAPLPHTTSPSGGRGPSEGLPLRTRLSQPSHSLPSQLPCSFGISQRSSELNAAETQETETLCPSRCSEK